jgi:ABC-2 type transport system ATP-binding protein
VSAVAVEHLSRRYGGLAALEDVSFEVAAGQVVALLGPNGAGKTTTMEILEGYQAPSGGTARVLGEDPACAGRAWRARVGLVLQSTCLDPQLTVVEALGIFAGLFPRPRPVAEVLELIDPPTRPAPGSGGCPAASSGALTSGSASSASPSCCSWTSRPPGSTRRPAARPGPPSRA